MQVWLRFQSHIYVTIGGSNMQHEQNKLKIHTNARPTAATQEQEAEAEFQNVQWESIPHPKQKARRHRTRRRRRNEKQTLTVGEKLLRNTAFSCALLLSVLALKNVEQPWGETATEGIRQVMNMRIDWDDTLGKLSFVRVLVPDTALVFLNLGSGVDMNRPVDGQIVHEFSEQQPWLEYSCSGRQEVCATLDGTVAAAGQGVGGEWIVMIESDGEVETVYGYLAESCVQTGQKVEAGQQIGATSEESAGRFYFELREQGNSVDPSGRMK